MTALLELGSIKGKWPWRRKWQPTSVFLPEESHGHRSLVVYSPWGRKESDTTEQLTHTSVNGGFPGGSVDKEPAYKAGDAGETGSIPGSGKSPGGGHGNPLQYSCMENHMNRGAWWATVRKLQRVGHD